jgi:hypothetical protein
MAVSGGHFQTTWERILFSGESVLFFYEVIGKQ